MAPLSIQIYHADGSLIITAQGEVDWEPYWDPNLHLNPIEFPGWGVDSNGNVYYDTDNPDPPDVVQTGIDPSGQLVLIK